MNQESIKLKHNWIKIIVGLVLLIVIISISAWWILKQPSKASAVKVETSLVDQQMKLEKDFTIESTSLDNPKIIVNPYKISPLSALVIFETDQSVKTQVTIVGKDKWSSFSHVFEEATEHRLPIYGLYAGQENQVEIKAGDQTKTVTIKTEPLPKDFPKVVELTANKEHLTNDLYFMTPASTKAKTVAFDVNGDVRWYLTESLAWEVKRAKNGRLLLSTERLIAAPYYNTGFYEMDLLGKVYTEYTLPGGYHHDIYQRKNGNYIVATDGTDDGRKTVEDVVVEIDSKTGEVIKTIDLSKMWPMDTGKSTVWTADDWFHNNSVWLDEEKDELLLSGRHQDAVAVLNYKAGTLKYIIGSPEGWSKEMQKYFLKPAGDNFEWQWKQHAAKALPNGDIVIFDNGNDKTKDQKTAVSAENSYSRAVVYRVDYANKTVEQIWQYGKERGASYYSPYISEADYLGDNHFLIHSGGVNYKDGKPTNLPAGLAKADVLRSYTTELLNGQVIFELVNDQNYYRAEKMPIYIKQDGLLKLGKANQLGALPRSETCTNIPLERAQSIDDEYKSHKIKLKREYDRLVMTGDFDKKAIVRLSLKRDKEQITYRMPIDKETESQALCVDILKYDHQTSGETKTATNYVNATGLSGKYRIYISIEDKVYDTAEAVEF